MIADIRGKLYKDGENLHDRLEDNLTGNVFGALRYVPAELGWRRIFESVEFRNVGVQEAHSHFNEFLSSLDFSACNVHFWQHCASYGELDVLIKTEDATAGIEVKLDSPLSSDDQLDRYSAYLSSEFPESRKYLILVAPQESGRHIVKYVEKQGHIRDDVAFGFVPWEDVLLSLKAVRTEDRYHASVIRDLCCLLASKGFDRFSGFSHHETITDDVYTYVSSAKTINWSTNEPVTEEQIYEFKYR